MARYVSRNRIRDTANSCMFINRIICMDSIKISFNEFDIFFVLPAILVGEQ